MQSFKNFFLVIDSHETKSTLNILCSWGINMTQDVVNAVKEAKEQSKPRNFTESIDIIINIRDLDVKKPENRFNE